SGGVLRLVLVVLAGGADLGAGDEREDRDGDGEDAAFLRLGQTEPEGDDQVEDGADEGGDEHGLVLDAFDEVVHESAFLMRVSRSRPYRPHASPVMHESIVTPPTTQAMSTSRSCFFTGTLLSVSGGGPHVRLRL